ncbi:Organic cation transporter 1 [Eumeta japonica]|uniref:Organic cation transporter 1 n=1 Tax=Eumeta variegata TaxID=151549 RepID=A0A4C1WZ53_EUMVA|nr:Organic cation transporter 1 [Eumeta japonica]
MKKELRVGNGVSKGKRTRKPSQYRWSSSPMGISNARRIAIALPASWMRLEHPMEGEDWNRIPSVPKATLSTTERSPLRHSNATQLPGQDMTDRWMSMAGDSQTDLIDGAVVGMSNGWTDWDEIFYVYSNGSLYDVKTQLDPVGGAAVGISPKAFLGGTTRLLAIPAETNGQFSHSRCSMYSADWDKVLSEGRRTPDDEWKVVPCKNGWEFNFTDVPYETIASQLGWVCEQDNLSAMAQAIFFCGAIVGGLVFGWIADKYGRIPALVVNRKRRLDVTDFEQVVNRKRRLDVTDFELVVNRKRRLDVTDFEQVVNRKRRLDVTAFEQVVNRKRRLDVTDFEQVVNRKRRLDVIDFELVVNRKRRLDVTDFEQVVNRKRRLDVTDFEQVVNRKRRLNVTDFEQVVNRKRRLDVTDFEQVVNRRRRLDVTDFEQVVNRKRRLDVNDFEQIVNRKRRLDVTDFEQVVNRKRRLDVIDFELVVNRKRRLDVTDFEQVVNRKRRLDVTDFELVVNRKRRLDVTDFEQVVNRKRRLDVTDFEQVVNRKRRLDVTDFEQVVNRKRRLDVTDFEQVVNRKRRLDVTDFEQVVNRRRRLDVTDFEQVVNRKRRLDVNDFEQIVNRKRRLDVTDFEQVVNRKRRLDVNDFEQIVNRKRRLDVTDFEQVVNRKRRLDVIDFELVVNRKRRLDVTDFEQVVNRKRRLDVTDFELVVNRKRRLDVTDFEQVVNRKRRLDVTDFEQVVNRKRRLDVTDFEQVVNRKRRLDVTDFGQVVNRKRRLDVTDFEQVVNCKRRLDVTDFEQVVNLKRRLDVTDFEQVVNRTNLIGFVAGIGTAFCDSFWSFALCRFLVGLAFDNCFTMMYILVLEYVGPKWRTFVANMSIALFFTLAASLLPWIALWADNWRYFAIGKLNSYYRLMQIYFAGTSAPFVLAIATPWLVPESARWLVSQGKIDKALTIMKKFEKINKTKIPDKVLSEFTESSLKTFKECETESKNYSVLDLFKTPRLRRNAILLIVIWMAISLVFDGHVRNVGSLGLDIFLTFTVASATELPADTFLTAVLDRWGRRWLACGSMVVSGVFSLFATTVPVGIPSATLAILGRFAVNISYNIGLQYAAELLPTVVRAQGVALIHIMGYVASIVAPFVVYLANISQDLPLLILGVLGILGGLLCLFLPETMDTEMPQTLQDGEDFGKNQKFWDNPCFPRSKNEEDVENSGRYVKRFSISNTSTRSNTSTTPHLTRGIQNGISSRASIRASVRLRSNSSLRRRDISRENKEVV